MHKCIFVLFLLVPRAAWAEEADLPAPNLKITWVGARGKTFTLNWPTESKWILQETSTPPYKKLIIRTWFSIPTKYRLSKFSWANKYRMNPKDSPLGSKQVISFDLKKRVETGNVVIQAKKKKTQYGLIVQVVNHKPFPWMSQTCRDNGMSVKQWRGGGENLYFAVNCRKKGKKIEVFFQRPLDSKMAVKATGVLTGRGADYRAYSFSLRRKPKGRQAIGAVKLKSSQTDGKKTSSFYNIYWGEKVPGQAKFNANVGIGPTLLDYSELNAIPGDVKDTSYVLTAKASGIYRFNEKLDVGGNVFGNFLTLSSSQTALPSPKFLGANIRGSYRLSHSSTVTLKGLLGWYIWATVGTENRYGVGYLTGPSFMVAAIFHRTLPRPFWVYAKYAPLEVGLSFKKREFAGGLGYEISTARARRQIAVTFDVAQVEVSFDNAINQVSLLSMSLGLQFGLTKR